VKQEIKVPNVGESVTRGTLSAWRAADGAWVEEGSDLFELETDKASMTVPSPVSGVLAISVPAGTEVDVGAVVASVETDAARPAAASGAAAAAPKAPPATSPAVRRIVAESGLDPSRIAGTGKAGRITKEDALKAAEAARAQPAPPAPRAPQAPPPAPSTRPAAARTASTGGTRRVPMSTIRRRIADRLSEAHRTAAYVTTFNEIDMEELLALRDRHRADFERVHGFKLGIVSFFVKACCAALHEYPEANAVIEGDEIVYHDSCDVGVAVSTDQGLLVPVVRSAETKSIVELEKAVTDLAERARARTILPDELAGGTFTVTNGGIFGSLLSTPLPAYPQPAILGLHAIQERPVVRSGAVVIRRMMYAALTYDHRLIDGRDAVGFLRRVKELVEEPALPLLEA
jgi:2-oxoglutarate dehydrogenase E2 component (dihydrolipoamide succinyltransferase)